MKILRTLPDIDGDIYYLNMMEDELNTKDVCLQLIYFNLEGIKREQIKEDS